MPTTPATVEYLDLAGVEKGQAAKVLPLEQLRTADALMHVVRAFDGEVGRSEGSSTRRPTWRRWRPS